MMLLAVIAPLLLQRPAAMESVQMTATTSVVIVLMDDVGFDLLEAAPTPNLDAVRDASARYTAWSYPVCSPTRACLISAQYGFRTGVGRNVNANLIGDGLAASTPSIADWVAAKSGWLGKWHVADAPSMLDHPFNVGFNAFVGTMANIGAGQGTYLDWEENSSGTLVCQTVYATTKNTDDVVRAVGPLKARLVVMSAYPVHKPWHVPPSNLHSQGNPTTALGKAIAALEAFDTELGRVLTALGPEDFLIVTSDNGTESAIAADSRSKGTLYQGGVSVPLWVSGPGIAAGDRVGLVDMVDVGPTALELLGLGQAPVSGIDGASFAASVFGSGLPTGRPYSYAERFGGGFRDRAIRDDRYKLIRRDGSPDELYDLEQDPTELVPLPTSGPAWQALSDALTALSGQ